MTVRSLGIVLVLACTVGCNGGDDSSPPPQIPAWPKFRQNVSNTGQGAGAVETNAGMQLWAVQIDEVDPKPVSASPAIAVDGTLFVGSEGGTLAAIAPDGTVRWRVATCDACPSGDNGTFAGFVSSPVAITIGSTTSILVGSLDGRFLVFQDAGSSAVCSACFTPQSADPSMSSAAFVSSATVTTHPTLGNVTGVFVGAIVTHAGDPTPRGRIYALNVDGSLQWQFPSAGSLGPITSSPALGVGGNLYFTTDDGTLIAVAVDGVEIWRFDLNRLETAPVRSAQSPELAPSAITTSTRVYAATASGTLAALTLDGQLAWNGSVGDALVSSLALGIQNVPIPTPTPTGSVIDTPPTPEPNATPTPTPPTGQSTLYGLSRSGLFVVRDAVLGTALPPSGPLPAPVSGEILSSPALSIDAYLVFATSTGILYVVDTGTGLVASGWPTVLAPGVPIRSSPSIGADGTIYVGTDDGQLYAVGSQ